MTHRLQPAAKPPSDRDPTQWYALQTRSGREYEAWQALCQLEGVEPFLPVFGPGRAEMRGGLQPRPETILFPGYLLFSANLSRELFKQLLTPEAILSVLGPRPGEASPIPPHEINLVRHIMGLDRSPLLGEMPEKGRVARIIKGPLQGVRGYVTWRNKSQARIATRLRFGGARAMEVLVPLNLIRVEGYEAAGPPSHPGGSRGGRRVRRSRQWHARHEKAA